jgi:hypothetical protein
VLHFRASLEGRVIMEDVQTVEGGVKFRSDGVWGSANDGAASLSINFIQLRHNSATTPPQAFRRTSDLSPSCIRSVPLR